MKKTLALILALALCLGALCACDSKRDTSRRRSSTSEDSEASSALSDEEGSSNSSEGEYSELSDTESSASSAEASYEESSQEASLPEETTVEETTEDEPYIKTNYALYKYYSVYKNGGMAEYKDLYLGYPDESFADIYLTRLTDGVSAGMGDFDSVGAAPYITVAHVGSGAVYEYIIDLGVSCDDIRSVVFRGVRDCNEYGGSRGFNENAVSVYVSESLGAWGDEISTYFTKSEVWGAPTIVTGESGIPRVENFDYTYTFPTKETGRYVRILVSSEVFVLQFDEIEIWN